MSGSRYLYTMHFHVRVDVRVEGPARDADKTAELTRQRIEDALTAGLREPWRVVGVERDQAEDPEAEDPEAVRRWQPAEAPVETTRMSRSAPWPCPKCGAPAGAACLTNPGSKTRHLSYMHIGRWQARPTGRPA